MKKAYIYSFFIFFILCGCDSHKDQKSVIEPKSEEKLIIMSDEEKKSLGDYMPSYPGQIEEYLEYRRKELPKIKSMAFKELLYAIEFLPDGGAYYPVGDLYAEGIINRGDAIVPMLVEQILNKEPAKVETYGSFHYSIGDSAIRLVEYASSDDFSLASYFIHELKEEGDFVTSESFEAEFSRIIIENPKNKKKLYHYLRKRYMDNSTPKEK